MIAAGYPLGYPATINQKRGLTMAMYFANYCPRETAERASETKVFFKLKDARAFMETKRGYIIRQSEPDHATRNGENTLQEWCGGFEPTAQDEQNIKTLLNK